MPSSRTLILGALFLSTLHRIDGSGRGVYYGAHRQFPTGDQFIIVGNLDGGSTSAVEKWNVECDDGQAFVGMRDSSHDFERLRSVWCRREFPDKAPTLGHYPYYDHCVVRNMTTDEFLCFDPVLDKKNEEHRGSYNTFIVGLYEDDSLWALSLSIPNKKPGPAFKCCQTPVGYVIDYSGCFLRYTHDQFGEYFDSSWFVTRCPDRYLMTGFAIQRSVIDNDRHYDWIQCCPVHKQSALASYRLRPHG